MNGNIKLADFQMFQQRLYEQQKSILAFQTIQGQFNSLNNQVKTYFL